MVVLSSTPRWNINIGHAKKGKIIVVRVVIVRVVNF
jgi:hypothetical protein